MCYTTAFYKLLSFLIKRVDSIPSFPIFYSTSYSAIHHLWHTLPVLVSTREITFTKRLVKKMIEGCNHTKAYKKSVIIFSSSC